MDRRLRFPLIVVAIAVVCGFAVRISFVNAHAVTVDSREYSLGEEVRLGEAFSSTSSESLEGYSLVVEGASVMSVSEYLNAFVPGDVEALVADGSSEVVVLNISISNADNEAGYLNYKNWRLTPPQRNTAYYIDYSLWYSVLPELNTGLGSFQVTPGTTVQLHIPFWHQDTAAALFSGGTEYVQDLYAPISGGDYEFVVTNIPRYAIAFSL